MAVFESSGSFYEIRQKHSKKSTIFKSADIISYYLLLDIVSVTFDFFLNFVLNMFCYVLNFQLIFYCPGVFLVATTASERSSSHICSRYDKLFSNITKKQF